MKKKGPRNEEVRNAIALLEKAARKGKQGIWKDVASRLGKPRRGRAAVNLWKLEKVSSKLGKKYMLVPGKVLSYGTLSRPVNVIALEFSEAAAKKISENGKAMSIAEALEAKVKPSEVAIIC